MLHLVQVLAILVYRINVANILEARCNTTRVDNDAAAEELKKMGRFFALGNADLCGRASQILAKFGGGNGGHRALVLAALSALPEVEGLGRQTG